MKALLVSLVLSVLVHLLLFCIPYKINVDVNSNKSKFIRVSFIETEKNKTRANNQIVKSKIGEKKLIKENKPINPTEKPKNSKSKNISKKRLDITSKNKIKNKIYLFEMNKGNENITNNETIAKKDNNKNNKLINSQLKLTSTKKRSSKKAIYEEYRESNYKNIQKNIQKNLYYPDIARKMGWEGDVLLTFTVCKNGKIEEIEISKSSGYKILDKSAVRVIEKISPLPKTPEKIILQIPIYYKLK